MAGRVRLGKIQRLDSTKPELEMRQQPCNVMGDKGEWVRRQKSG